MEDLLPSESVSAMEQGEYEGVYYDVMGHRGEIRFSLKREEQNFEGSCELILTDTDEPVAFRGTAESFAEVKEGQDEPSTARFRLEFVPPKDENYTTSEQQGLWTAEFMIYVRPATPFAKQAMYGTLRATGDPGLSGGVWIAWKYAT